MEFLATHLGHRSWIVADKSAAIAIDPVLDVSVGRPAGLRLVYPPRTVLPDRFPRLDAVILTCEDEDHVDLPSIASIAQGDGNISVFTTSRASASLHRALREIGLETRIVQPFTLTNVGGFDIGMSGSTGLEPTGVVVSNRATGDSFARSTLGTWDSEWRWLRELGLEPHVVVLSCSTIDLRFQRAWTIVRQDPTVDIRSRALEAWKKIAVRWGAPRGIVLEDDGISFAGDLAWMNHEAFPAMLDGDAPVSHPSIFTATAGDVFALMEGGDRLKAELRTGQREPVWSSAFRRSPLPAPTNGSIQRMPEAAPFVQLAPRSAWPLRTREEQLTWIEGYRPACGRTACSEADWDLIARQLDGFGRHLYGRAIFKGLLSLAPDEWMGRRPTFAFALLDGDRVQPQDVGMEYALQRGSFARCEAANMAVEFAAVFECWAADLAAMLRGEIDVTSIEYGRCRMWNARPDRFRFDLIGDLREYAHPLRQPQRALDVYQGRVSSCG